MVFGNKSIHLRNIYKGGSITIKRNTDSDSSALANPSIGVQNKTSKVMGNDVSQNFQPFPVYGTLQTGTSQSTFSSMPREKGVGTKNFLGGALDSIKFGKKEREKKVKLRI